MDSQNGKTKRNRARSRRLEWFFLNGEIHRRLHINLPDDVITTWNYVQNKRIGYSYRDVKRRAEPAFRMSEVAKMLNRKRNTLEIAILNGDIRTPQMTYGLSEHRRPYAYMWSEKDIMDAHDYFSTVHKGRPRKDGLITPMKMPSKHELRAMIRDETITYVQREDGTFVPTWKAEF